jgi:hypothetical protein
MPDLRLAQRCWRGRLSAASRPLEQGLRRDLQSLCFGASAAPHPVLFDAA